MTQYLKLTIEPRQKEKPKIPIIANSPISKNTPINTKPPANTKTPINAKTRVNTKQPINTKTPAKTVSTQANKTNVAQAAVKAVQNTNNGAQAKKIAEKSTPKLQKRAN